MRFKVYFTKADVEDYFIIEGESLEDVKIKAREELHKRGLTVESNFVWSEEIKWN